MFECWGVLLGVHKFRSRFIQLLFETIASKQQWHSCDNINEMGILVFSLCKSILKARKGIQFGSSFCPPLLPTHSIRLLARLMPSYLSGTAGHLTLVWYLVYERLLEGRWRLSGALTPTHYPSRYTSFLRLPLQVITQQFVSSEMGPKLLHTVLSLVLAFVFVDKEKQKNTLDMLVRLAFWLVRCATTLR